VTDIELKVIAKVLGVSYQELLDREYCSAGKMLPSYSSDNMLFINALLLLKYDI